MRGEGQGCGRSAREAREQKLVGSGGEMSEGGDGAMCVSAYELEAAGDNILRTKRHAN